MKFAYVAKFWVLASTPQTRKQNNKYLSQPFPCFYIWSLKRTWEFSGIICLHWLSLCPFECNNLGSSRLWFVTCLSNPWGEKTWSHLSFWAKVVHMLWEEQRAGRGRPGVRHGRATKGNLGKARIIQKQASSRGNTISTIRELRLKHCCNLRHTDTLMPVRTQFAFHL